MTDKQRATQISALIKELGDRGHPIIIAGDFNATPEETTLQLLSEAGFKSFGDPQLLTFPAPAPIKTIDYIMEKGLPVQNSVFKVIDEREASDHRPIFCEITLGSPAEKK